MIDETICDMILHYGKIISDISNTFPDGEYRTYQIIYENHLYILTKHNGTWCYIHRVNKG